LAYDRARNIIEEHSEALVRIAEALLEREILDGEEVMQLIKGEELATLDTGPGAGASGKDEQEVIKPEGDVRTPPIIKGDSPQPA
jgi:cell division protease FtsH